MGAPSKIALSGFIGNTHDALIVFEACRRGLLPRATGRLSEAERKAIKSGDIFVFNEEESQIKRWTDGKRWSPSRILNNFSIYREVKADEHDEEDGEDGAGADASTSKIDNEEIDELAPPTSTASTSATAVGSSTASISAPQPSPESSNASRVVDPKLRNITGGLELLPNRKEGGLIKKTISVAGLHMISYYAAEEVIAGRLRQPGTIPELANIDISHPFLMAQFFRHPPQVTFDADQMPHFAGITDDEPMIRKPAAQPRKKKQPSEQLTPNAREASLPGSSQTAFQNISNDPPVVSTLPPRTSLSPTSQHRPQHMLSSQAVQPHDQSLSSVLSHISTDMNPLLPPVRPSPGSRSSTGHSGASTSDSSSPRTRPSISHSNRHEPYKVPIPRHRYSITDMTHPIPQEHMPPYSYPRQASLPNPGMDYYRPRMQQLSSFAAPYPTHIAGQYSAPIPSTSENGNPDYRYTLAGAEHMQQVPWPSHQQGVPPPDSPRSFYSTTSSLQTGQLATGEPPYSAELHSSGHSSMYTSGNIAQPDYSQTTLYGPSGFYGGSHADADAGQSHPHPSRPWYGHVSDGQIENANVGHAQVTHSQPSNLIAPQAVQHLAGFLPETGYSPLLPSSAAYASDVGSQEQSRMEEVPVKSESYSPGKQGTYGPAEAAYITGPPPPVYTQPDQRYQEESKVCQPHASQQEVQTYQALKYTESSVYNPGMEDPRDS